MVFPKLLRRILARDAFEDLAAAGVFWTVIGLVMEWGKSEKSEGECRVGGEGGGMKLRDREEGQ